MNKKNLVDIICSKLELELKSAKEAALETYAAATGEESRPENEYDTRALEASYLAGAQAQRVREIEEALIMYKFLELKSFNEDTPIGPTALVELDLKDKISTVFLVPLGGGMVVTCESKAIQVLTPKSPLGEALIGLNAGDMVLLDKNKTTVEYEILSVE